MEECDERAVSEPTREEGSREEGDEHQASAEKKKDVNYKVATGLES